MDLIPGIRGVVLEHPTERDIDVAYDVAYECERQLGTLDLTRARVANELIGPEAIPGVGLLGYRGDEGVGLVTMECDPTGREIFASIYATTQPQRPLIDALLDYSVRVARARAAEDPCPQPEEGVDRLVLSPDLWQLVAGQFEHEDEYAAALMDHGFAPIRRFWRMRWDVTGLGRDDPTPPAGVIKRVVSGEDDSRLFHRLYTESFAAHFGSSHDQPYEQWIEAIRALAGYDTERCWIAALDGEPVGMCLIDDSRVDFGATNVRTLGVLEFARGRGVGSWLLRCAAADAVRRGLPAVMLGVDSTNETGAASLYESVGFAVVFVIVVWCYPLLEAPESAASRYASPHE